MLSGSPGQRRAGTAADRLAAVDFNLARFELEAIRRCDLCGGEVFLQIARRDRYGIPVRSQLCRGCGLVFLAPRPTAGSYAEIYRRYYRPLVAAFSGDPFDGEALKRLQKRYAGQLDDNLLSRYLTPGQGGRLLDIGASTGTIADHFVRRYGFEPLCIEPAPDEAAKARERGFETFEGLIEDFDPGDRRFELILLCQTVDHLLEPSTVLERIHRWLAPEGLFFVDPVDFRALMRSAHRLDTALKIDHPFYLTRETMDLYLERAGLEPIAIDVSGNVFHIDYVCRRGEPRTPEGDRRFARDLYDEVRWVQATDRLRHASGSDRAGLAHRWLRRLVG